MVSIRKKKKTNRNKLPAKTLAVDSGYDFSIILLVTAFVIFGVVMVFSAGYYTTVSLSDPDPYYYLKKQGTFAILGVIIMYITAKVDYHWYKRIAYIFIGISIVLLLMLFTPLGVTVNYATRWIFIGPIRITPSEISKLAVIIFTSTFLAADPKKINNFKEGILPLAIVMGIHAALIIKQPNLSTAIVICALMVGIMFLCGLDVKYIVFLAVLMVLGMIYILLALPDSHWYARLTNWVDPFADSQGEGYQVSQSLLALGNGGIFGRGLGNSISKNLYLPEPQNDFILAIIGEELGFVGIFVMMAGYILLTWRGFTAAVNAKDKLGFFMASGITMMLALQVIINVAVVTASMPATGITLPFVSYGGTSLLIFMAAMGILLNISKKGKEK